MTSQKGCLGFTTSASFGTSFLPNEQRCGGNWLVARMGRKQPLTNSNFGFKMYNRPSTGAQRRDGSNVKGAPANPYERIQFLQDRINCGFADGSLDRREAWRANRELNGVRQWIRHMHWRGNRLTPDQRARVQPRLDQISQQIRWARHNRR